MTEEELADIEERNLPYHDNIGSDEIKALCDEVRECWKIIAAYENSAMDHNR